jgi:hypothetical protein
LCFTKQGITSIETELSDYIAGIKMTREQTDRAQTTRKTQETVRHDLWFREQVKISLIEADSPHAAWIEAEDIRTRMEQRIKSRMGSTNN